MKITITEGDLQKALEEIKHSPVCKCCLVFQALKREGFDVDGVGYDNYTDSELKSHELKNIFEVTHAFENKWPEYVGHVFEA